MSCTDAVAAIEAAGTPLRTRRGHVRIVTDNPPARSITRKATATMTATTAPDVVASRALTGTGSPATPYATNAVVARLEPRARRILANVFIGRTVKLTTGRGPHDYSRTITGYVEGIATVHSGTSSDAIVLTVRPNTHDLSRFEAFPLADVRSIREL